MNIMNIQTARPVQGLEPKLYPCELVMGKTWLQCGKCGFNGVPKHCIFTEAPWCFEPVCDCPLPATLTA